MTPSVMKFLQQVGPQKHVLEIGSRNINGTARDAFPHDTWLGVDFIEGPGVDLVCDASRLGEKIRTLYDCVVIAECLEHCEDWRAVLRSAWDRLRVGGKMAITTPSPGFPFHGYPHDYWRFTASDWFDIFRDQHIDRLGSYVNFGSPGGPGSGIIVTKFSDKLHLDIQPAYVTPGKIIYSTAVYKCQVYSTFMHCVIRDLSNWRDLGVQAELRTVEGDSYIARAKNTLCARFLEDPDATVMMLIDFDHWWEPEAVPKLCNIPGGLAGADYRMKNSPDGTFCVHPKLDADGEMLGELRPGRSPLIDAETIPGGFMRIRKSALLKFKEAYPDDVYVDHSADPSHPDCVYTAFFDHNLKGNNGGEDRHFCRKWLEMGEKIWVDPDVSIGHWWDVLHMGNRYENMVSEKMRRDLKEAGVELIANEAEAKEAA